MSHQDFIHGTKYSLNLLTQTLNLSALSDNNGPDDNLLAHKRKLKSGLVKEGEKAPCVVFKARVRDAINGDSAENPFCWKDVTSESLFAGKRVVLFSLPGAFTPTCSSTHLPGYENNYQKLKNLGIDEIFCLSVNDAFVMRQWGLKQGLSECMENNGNLNPGNFTNVKLIPDGACAFTRGMGASCVWDKNRGFGERSWRYSCVLNDMVVEKIFVEGGGIVQDSDSDPYEVSDVDTMLKYLKNK